VTLSKQLFANATLPTPDRHAMPRAACPLAHRWSATAKARANTTLFLDKPFATVLCHTVEQIAKNHVAAMQDHLLAADTELVISTEHATVTKALQELIVHMSA
jgi:hypothetical protein